MCIQWQLYCTNKLVKDMVRHRTAKPTCDLPREMQNAYIAYYAGNDA